MIERKAIKKLSPYLFEIPKSYRADMRVPARVYADETLLSQILDDQSLEQLVNTATLPGIVKYALAMPDIHQGYGFSIGGVVATDPAQGGVISPGGVGYDVNCFTGDALVLHELGFTQPIKDMAVVWRQAKLKCQNLVSGYEDVTHVLRFIRRPPHRPLRRVTTDCGHDIVATDDHPFWTPDGMVELRRIQPGDRVATYPQLGVPYEPPANTVLVEAADIQRILADRNKGQGGNAVGQVLKHLTERSLLPLDLGSPHLPLLAKLVGFVFGDGTIYFDGGSGKGVTWFYGDESDLETIRADVAALGFTPSRIYRRERTHRIRTTYNQYEFDRVETSFKVVGSAFAALLVALGAPVGAKANQDYRVPDWLYTAPRWLQRLYLAALFGAELSAPSAYPKRNHNFMMPMLSLNKRDGTIDSGRLFLRDIAGLLTGFDVEVKGISQRAEQTNADGTVSHRLRLTISTRPESLINLWGRIGYEYNRKRQRLAGLAVAYLEQKSAVIVQRQDAAVAAVEMQTAGIAREAIFAELVTEHVNQRFVERSLYEARKTPPRVETAYETFRDFQNRATEGIEGTGMVWARVVSNEVANQTELHACGFDGYVYDFTVAHDDHNFIANGFVVSNCGVRLLASEMEEGELRPHLDKLATALYQHVPSGVGEKGFLRVSDAQMDEVLRTGARWALQQGMARPEDLAHTEENGSMAGADPDKVSRRAKERGRSQIGTLGAGNHFAEIDVVDALFDETAAAAMGLFEGQVVVQ
ncbi:MAG TPA: RtcB family protein, partial [Candidatus Sulfomarinibacteraceae bacterium]|nr:RtcB family protein [Candidatus Sulfomarinibacteraceae bacterium]